MLSAVIFLSNYQSGGFMLVLIELFVNVEEEEYVRYVRSDQG